MPVTFNKNLSQGIGGWRHPKAKQKVHSLVSAGLKKMCRPGNSKPKYPKAEAVLKNEALEKRRKGKKVSARWIQIRSRQLMREHYPDVAFKGGRGYQRRACKR